MRTIIAPLAPEVEAELEALPRRLRAIARRYIHRLRLEPQLGAPVQRGLLGDHRCRRVYFDASSKPEDLFGASAVRARRGDQDLSEGPKWRIVYSGTNAQAVIKRLNPIIRGWAAYYRTQVSSDVFSALDHYLWRLIYKWAGYSHQNKPKSWVVARYFDRFNKSRQDRWVFGDRTSGAYLHRFSWTRILRHRIVRHRASPDDPTLAEYWAWRRRKLPLPINKTTQELTDAQEGRCPICKGLLFGVEDRPQTPREWEKWLATRTTATIATTRATGNTEEAEPRLAHAACRHGTGLALHTAHEPSGLA